MRVCILCPGWPAQAGLAGRGRVGEPACRPARSQGSPRRPRRTPRARPAARPRRGHVPRTLRCRGWAVGWRAGGRDARAQASGRGGRPAGRRRGGAGRGSNLGPTSPAPPRGYRWRALGSLVHGSFGRDLCGSKVSLVLTCWVWWASTFTKRAFACHAGEKIVGVRAKRAPDEMSFLRKMPVKTSLQWQTMQFQSYQKYSFLFQHLFTTK